MKMTKKLVALSSLVWVVMAFCADDAERHASEMMNASAVSSVKEVAGGVKVLFLGNSITIHGSMPKIGWTNVWGMAASAKDKDYVHIVTRGIEAKTGRRADVRVRNLADFERNYRIWSVEDELKDVIDFDPEYLIVALGENVPNLTTADDRISFRKAFKNLLGCFVNGAESPNVVVRGVFWENPTKDYEMEQVASYYAVPFVRADLAAETSMTAKGLFWHEGVQRHPGDKGMAAIASLILKALFPSDQTSHLNAPYELKRAGQVIRLETARISAMPFNRVWPGYQRSKDQTRMAYFVNVDAGGELTIAGCGAALPPHTLRPMSRRPLRMINGCLVTDITVPEQFIVDFGEALPPLHVFVNPPAASVPSPCAHYFGPGEHDVGVLAPKSGETVYIDKDAVVYGALFVKDANDVRIMGHGILDNSQLTRADPIAKAFRRENGLPEIDTEFACGAFTVYASTNVVIEGITVRDTPFWSLIVRNGCKNVTVDNVKVIGQWRYNSDGFDFCASEDVTARNCFIRSFDDCVVARGPYLDGETTPVRNVLVENCVLWCDWGKNLEVWAGHLPCLIDGVTYRNNKLIGVASLPCDVTCWYGSTNTVIRNVVMENLEIDLDGDRCEHVYQKSDSQEFVRRPLQSQKLWEITLNPPTINLGNQQRCPVDDISPYRALVENVRFSRFEIFGEQLPFLCRQKASAPGHLIRNVVVEALPNCRFVE